MNTSREMPRYQCHKKVWALKIASVAISKNGVWIVPEDASYAPFEAPDGWAARYRGDNDHGYYVVYDDGYASWSPSKAFEDGYTRIDG